MVLSHRKFDLLDSDGCNKYVKVIRVDVVLFVT